MRAIDLDEFGGPEVLRLVTRPKPEVRPNDLLVKVMAIGVNRADLNQRRGAYGRADFGDSDLMGLEVAGEVVAVGREVSTYAPGDRVMGIVGGGAYAEFARIDHRMAMRIPDAVTFVEAAAIPEAFVTAHEALLHLGRLSIGETALIHGAAGGVGVAAVQLAVRAGARVLFTSRAERIDDVMVLGPELGLDYRAEGLADAVRRATGGGGADVILSHLAGEHFETNLAALADGGRLIQIGLMGGAPEARLGLDRLLFGRLQVIGTVMKSQMLEAKVAMTQRFWAAWRNALSRRELVAIVDKILPLSEAAEAHRRMEAGGHFGKLVLVPDAICGSSAAAS
jgi:NADPH:quinone reductase